MLSNGGDLARVEKTTERELGLLATLRRVWQEET